MSIINIDKPILTGLEPNSVTPVGLTGSKYIGGKLKKNKKYTNKKQKTKRPCKHVYAGNSKKCIKCEYSKIFRNKSKKNFTPLRK